MTVCPALKTLELGVTSHPPRHSELIDVRVDEYLDPTRLESWLRTNLPVTNGELNIKQFGGGHANLTYLIKFGRHEYVLRRPPLGPIVPRSHDMKREHRVLARLQEVYPLAPVSYALCVDPTVIGVDFHIMERRHGFVIRQQLPPDLKADPAKTRKLSETVVDGLTDLHRIDPRTVGLNNLGKPSGYVSRQLTGWITRWMDTKRTLPSVKHLIRWLQDNPPSQQTTTLLHNDYQLENILVNTADPTRAVAVLDWDMCTRGDPLMDLGYLLNCWGDQDDDPWWGELTPMPQYEPGLLTRREIVERYAKQTGFNVERSDWYHVFGVFKLLVILQQIHIRFLRHQTQDERFSTLGTRVEGLAKKGLALI